MEIKTFSAFLSELSLPHVRWGNDGVNYGVRFCGVIIFISLSERGRKQSTTLLHVNSEKRLLLNNQYGTKSYNNDNCSVWALYKKTHRGAYIELQRVKKIIYYEAFEFHKIQVFLILCFP